MASTSILLTLTLTTLLFLLPSTLSAPAPINLTDILVRGVQFTTFLRLLNQTQVLDQLQNQLNNSNQGMTLFAPTEKAFQNLPAGTINRLSEEEIMKLALYHILQKYYSMEDLVEVSNPVPTQLGGDHGSLGLNFTGRANQVNVSTGVVETRINKALRKDFPFAVYVIDQVLIPLDFSEVLQPEGSSSSSPPAGAKAPSSSAAGKHGAKAPSSPAEKSEAMAPSSPVGKPEDITPSSPGGKPEAMAPRSPEISGAMAPTLLGASPSKNGGVRMRMGFGCFVVFCMAFV